jgi:hypothetical protein
MGNVLRQFLLQENPLRELAIQVIEYISGTQIKLINIFHAFPCSSSSLEHEAQPCHISRMVDTTEFDPLAVENIGVTLAVELLEQPLTEMPPLEPFPGSGIYALYYSGENEAYRTLVELDTRRFKYPVYIGKASGACCRARWRCRVCISFGGLCWTAENCVADRTKNTH